MKTLDQRSGMLLLAAKLWMLCAVVGLVGCSAYAVEHKPADLPENYRDVQIYATSEADASDPDRIVVTVHMMNRGDRALPTRVSLLPDEAAGFDGDSGVMTLMPGRDTTWVFEMQPPDGMRREILEGEIRFGKTLARDLKIAVQGPDPAGAEFKDVQRIVDKAQVVGTHAPRVQIDWWQTDPTSSIAPNQRRKPLITLASKGDTDHVIVVRPMPAAEDGGSLTLDEWAEAKNKRPGENELIAAVRDLQRCVEIMSDGGRMRVLRGRPAGKPAIILSINEHAEWKHNDSYRLSSTPDGFVRIEAGTLDGLRQGIYGLLVDHLDCHWFMPGEMGEEIPRPEDQTVVLGQIDERGEPAFFSGHGTSWGSHRDWDMRNRSYINRARMVYGHAWTGFISKADYPYEEHPDMWARDRDGEILVVERSAGSTNFCSTSPEVIEIVARKVNERLRNPDVIVTSLDPNDYSPMCLCDRCLALDRMYGVEDQDGTYVTDRLLHFSNEIYDRLDPENKDKYLGILVYAFQIELPTKARAHDRHAGMVCNMGWTYDHTRPFTDPTDPTNRDFYRLVKGWGEILPQLGYYDYYGHWRRFGPWGQVQKMREDLVAFRDLGGTYLMLECQPNFPMAGLNHYIAGQLSWDVDADVDVLLEEFFTKFYGPAAAPMRAFWLDIEEYYALLRAGPHAAERVRHTPGLWATLAAHLDEALVIAEALPESEKRYLDRIEFTRDGFDMARRQYLFERTRTLQGDDPPDDVNKRRWIQYGADESDWPQVTDPQQIIDEANAHLEWIQSRREKYNDSPYWPTFLPAYYFPRVEKDFSDPRAKAEQRLQQQGG